MRQPFDIIQKGFCTVQTNVLLRSPDMFSNEVYDRYHLRERRWWQCSGCVVSKGMVDLSPAALRVKLEQRELLSHLSFLIHYIFSFSLCGNLTLFMVNLGGQSGKIDRQGCFIPRFFRFGVSRVLCQGLLPALRQIYPTKNYGSTRPDCS